MRQTSIPGMFCRRVLRLKQYPKGWSDNMTIINKIALAIAIVGTLNWGLVGLFSFDLVAWLSGGPQTVLARIIYVAVALAGVWCISLLFHNEDEALEHGV